MADGVVNAIRMAKRGYLGPARKDRGALINSFEIHIALRDSTKDASILKSRRQKHSE